MILTVLTALALAQAPPEGLPPISPAPPALPLEVAPIATDVPGADGTLGPSLPASEIEALRAEIEGLRSAVAAQSAAIEALRTQVAVAPPAPITPPAEGALSVAPGAIVPEAIGAVGQDIYVMGHVRGSVLATGADVYVRPGARVDGDVLAYFGQVHVDEGAQISGTHASLGAPGPSMRLPTSLGQLTDRLVFLLTIAGAGVLVVGLMPTRVTHVAARLRERPGRSFVAGAFIASLLLSAALLFLLTLVGLPLTLLLVMVLAYAWLLGFVGLSQAVGEQLPFTNPHHGRWVALLIGSLIVTFLGSLPYVGWMVVLSAGLVGAGAAFTTRFGAVAPRPVRPPKAPLLGTTGR